MHLQRQVATWCLMRAVSHHNCAAASIAVTAVATAAAATALHQQLSPSHQLSDLLCVEVTHAWHEVPGQAVQH